MGGKYTKLPLTKLPNGNEIYQMAENIHNGHKIYQQYAVQGPPKFTQIGIFGLKINTPSGDPA
jgi:hypothetical protein